MSAHAPGPWRAGYGDGVTGPRAAPSAYWDETTISHVPVRRGKEVVCWVASSRETDDDLLPDARLIAAAPEMLEALREAEACAMRNGWMMDAQDDDRFAKALCGIRAAIAKAEGRS